MTRRDPNQSLCRTWRFDSKLSGYRANPSFRRDHVIIVTDREWIRSNAARPFPMYIFERRIAMWREKTSTNDAKHTSSQSYCTIKDATQQEFSEKVRLRENLRPWSRGSKWAGCQSILFVLDSDLAGWRRGGWRMPMAGISFRFRYEMPAG